MERERIDLSSLDPFPDPARFERLVGSISARAVAARRRRLTVAGQLAAWARPALALAAAVALAVWAPSLVTRAVRGSEAGDEAAGSVDPAPRLMQWAAGEQSPSTTELMELLGGAYGGASP